MIHQVKIRKCFFEEKIAGRKAWELRLDDRNYQILMLRGSLAQSCD